MPRPPKARLAAVALAAFTGAALLGAVAGCGYLPRPTRVPLRTIDAPSSCPTRPETLVVMLPGAYSFPEDFVREGFVAALQNRGVAADVRLVDAHLGYYRDRTILDRLDADVVRPARAAGYRRIWFVGISVGALGSMLYADTHPGAVDGIVAIGPYLGEPPLIDAIAAQGGLAGWMPRTGDPDPQGTVEVWRWLQATLRPAVDHAASAVDARSAVPSLLIGFGVDDRYAAGQRLLAAALPPNRVATAPGGHDWRPWRATWNRLLDTLPLPREDGCRVASAPSKG